ncbi:MAG: hypothetical protein IPN96_16270 [Anaerolineales bacterium]|jgi:hypothetical protein|nr:hypothetical protein [Anaerolineales bacterium]MBK8823766.1 hypothetical protein [Anaerolineales bacterium]
MRSPRFLLTLGLILMSMGFILPVLMVMRILPLGFFLSFLSWTSSVAGLFLSVIAVAYMVNFRR